MNIQTATEVLADFIRENIVDPISKRASSWIYTDEGRVELDKSPYPKITISPFFRPSDKQIAYIGNTQTMNTDTILIKIKAKFGEHYGYGQVNYTGKEFVGFISEQIEQLIKTKQDELVDKCFVSVLPLGETMEYDKEFNPTHILRIELKYIS